MSLKSWTEKVLHRTEPDHTDASDPDPAPQPTAPAAPAPPTPEQVTCRDGRAVTVRPIQANDADRLREFLQDGLSNESRYTRFLAAMPVVSCNTARYLANRNQVDRAALIAETSDGVIVALAEYAADPRNPETLPEVAYAVADDWQGLGLGSTLLRRLTAHARAVGFRGYSAEILCCNNAANKLLASAGTVHRGSVECGVWSYEVIFPTD